MRFLTLRSGTKVNCAAVEAVMIGDGAEGWPVLVVTAGREYLDHRAGSENAAALAADEIVALLVEDTATVASCANCGTPLRRVDGVGWVHLVRAAARGDCGRPLPVTNDQTDRELSRLLNDNGETQP